MAEICSARLEGCDPGSSTVLFEPREKPQLARLYAADPGTAGSIALLLQVSLPCLLFGAPSLDPSTLRLRGGTNASQSPQVDYTLHVFLPFIRKHFGLAPALEVVKRGYYPKGGGEVRVVLPAVPGPIPSVTLTHRGEVTAVHGRSYVAGLPKSLAESMRAAAIRTLGDAGIPADNVHIDAVRDKPAESVGSGSGIVLWAETSEGCILGGSALGRKGVDPSQVGCNAARELVANLAHGGCVDEYMQVGTGARSAL